MGIGSRHFGSGLVDGEHPVDSSAALVSVRLPDVDLCDPAWKSDPLMEWAPWAGQIDSNELTREPGFQRMEAHGQAPHAQHRIQAPSRSGIPGRRDLHGLAKRNDICQT